MNEARKRLFIILLTFSVLFLGLIFTFAWWVVSKQSILINQIILTLALVFFIIVFLIIIIGLISLIYSLLTYKSYKGLNIFINKAINFLFPLALRLGKWFGFESDQIKNSFIQVSNQLVKLESKKVPPDQVLILAPHCLQRVECPHKITVNVNNCKRCGKCSIGDLLTLSKEKGVQLVVATGGTFARKFIKERKPKAIVAIACERDLTSGIQDVDKIPVIGIVNERPEGPCHNTRVNICRVEKAINYFVQGGDF